MLAIKNWSEIMDDFNPQSDWFLDEIERELENTHQPVHFKFVSDGSQAIKIIENWLDAHSIELFSVFPRCDLNKSSSQFKGSKTGGFSRSTW